MDDCSAIIATFNTQNFQDAFSGLLKTFLQRQQVFINLLHIHAEGDQVFFKALDHASEIFNIGNGEIAAFYGLTKVWSQANFYDIINDMLHESDRVILVHWAHTGYAAGSLIFYPAFAQVVIEYCVHFIIVSYFG
ncbi:MAG: hypothetical protein ACD_39C01034G0001 [uncultured bacterium]|nr:MAG: hypothetical protein ACD_39C01034G0001 [uncultured bacterium]